MTDAGFTDWYTRALDECKRGNGGVPPWLLNHETAKEFYTEMRASEMRDYAKSMQAQELAGLRRRNADLEKRVAQLEHHLKQLFGTPYKDGGIFAKVVGEVLGNTRKELGDRITALEARPVDAVDLDFDLDADTRTLHIKNGAATKSFALPIPSDRGIYKHGTAYSVGDCVSYQGSYWICKEFTGDRPGKSKYWRLVAKRGADGRDAGR